MSHLKQLAKAINLDVSSSKHSKSKYNPKKVSSSNLSFSSTTNKSFSKILHKHQPENGSSTEIAQKNRRKSVIQFLQSEDRPKKDIMNITEISYEQVCSPKFAFKNMNDCYEELMKLKRDFEVFQQIICQQIEKQKHVVEEFVQSILQNCIDTGRQYHEAKEQNQSCNINTLNLNPLSSQLNLNMSETGLQRKASFSKFLPHSPKNSSALVTPKIRKQISFKKFNSAIENLRVSMEQLSDKKERTTTSKIPSHFKHKKNLILN